MSEIKTIECAAYDYQATAADVSGGLAPYYVDAFLAGAKHQKELSAAREKLLMSVIEEMRVDLETISKHCICKRNTFGFDYHEDHLYLGKPKSGSRWLTPFDIIKSTLSNVAKKLEGL